MADDEQELVGLEGARECPETPVSAGRIREWRNWLRNGWLLRETVAIVKIAAPMVANNFFYQVMFTVALVFVGNSSDGSLELDAAALALSFMNVTGVSVGVGLSTAAETLCAQMYGVKNYRGLGMVTQRGVVELVVVGIWILGLALFPILIIWLNTESFLLLIQQDPCVARLTALYVKIFASALPALFLFIMLQRYLVAQSIVLLFVMVGIVNNVVSAALHGVFIYWVGMGVEGSAIALSLATIASPILLLLYIRLRKLHHQTWSGWSFDGLRGWGQFVRLGIPGLLMVCFEWWCFELAAFVTGSISKTQLAIHTIIIQILSLNFMLPYGVSMGLTVRVGNELGAGNPQRAKQATYAAFAITLLLSVVVAVFLGATHSVLGRIFTRDKDVVDGVGEVLYLTIPLVFSDGFQGVMQGVLRGTGKQLSGAVVNFVSYYIVGLPTGTLLAILAGMGARGMWIGLLLASVLQMTCYFVIVVTLKWEKQSHEAIKRAQNSKGSAADASPEVKRIRITEEGEGEGEGEREGGDDDRELLVLRDFKNCGSERKKTNHSEELIEELPLISMGKEDGEVEEDDEKVVRTGEEPVRTRASEWRSKLSANWRLVLSRLTLLAVAVVLLVLGGLASQYQPHRPLSDYCDCTSPSGNSTGEWACGNETTTTGTDQGSVTVSPSLSPSAVVRPVSSYVMPTSSPLA